MSVRSAQSITVLFTTRAFATGAATDATGTPTGTLYVNGTADAASVTVTNLATGIYKAAVTLPTLAAGDVVEMRINATVSGVTDNGIIWGDSKDLALDSSYRPGIDWSNVGAPTTTLALTGTTVGVTTALTNLPAITTGWITAAGIADGAIDAATFASGALDAVWSVTPRTITGIDSGGIVAATFASGALDAVWSTAARTITGGTIGAYTGNTPQTGDSYAIVNSVTIGNSALKTAIGLLPTLGEFFTVDSGEAYADAIAGSVVKEIADNANTGGGGLDADGIRDAVGLATANLDTQLGALPTLGEFFTVDSGQEYADAIDGSVVKEIAANSAGGGGGEVTLDLTQAIPTTNTANTLGDCLNGARAQAFGNWARVGMQLILYAPNGITVVHTFNIDSVLAPTSRTSA